MSDEIETREIRARFVSHHAEGARVHKERSRQVFNAWLDAELRKARVEALREAEEAMYKSKGYALLEEDGESYSIGKDNASIVEDWLLDRADREEDQ